MVRLPGHRLQESVDLLGLILGGVSALHFAGLSMLSFMILYYIDSLGFGFPVLRNFTEYKWLANDFGLPLCTVTDDGLLPMIVVTHRQPAR